LNTERLGELRPFVDAARQMQGWTFTYEPVPVGPPPPWDYDARARDLLRNARAVLDMGTGGGERLASLLREPKPQTVVATEGWPPNVPVAARRLGPLGVHVLHSLNLTLPLAAGSLDLVLNRHEELDPADVARVLRPGGRVLTQQIHPDYHAELRAFFPRMTLFDPHDELYPAGFEAAGLRVETRREHGQAVAYRHLGHLVYELVAAPWTVPDFDLESDLDALLRLEAALGGPQGIVLTDRRYLLKAVKPGGT
jgi:SAM-dependent methyltransferase